MSIEILTELAIEAHGFAVNTINNGGELPPFTIYRKGDGSTVRLIIKSYANHKEETVFALHVKMRQEKATDYIIGFEAWLSKPKGGRIVGMARDDPDREDVVSICGGDNKGISIAWSAQIATALGMRYVKPLEKFFTSDSPEAVVEGSAAHLLYDRDAN